MSERSTPATPATPAAPPFPPLLVFAQRPDAGVDVDAWNAHAERHLATRIGLADVRAAPPDGISPARDAVRFVVAPSGSAPGIRRASARPRRDDDLARARAAEQRHGAAGLSQLAARCPTVWLVEPESDGDALAWALAVVLSSVLLGPILDEPGGRLVGAKTGRAIWESLPGVVR